MYIYPNIHSVLLYCVVNVETLLHKVYQLIYDKTRNAYHILGCYNNLRFCM